LRVLTLLHACCTSVCLCASLSLSLSVCLPTFACLCGAAYRTCTVLIRMSLFHRNFISSPVCWYTAPITSRGAARAHPHTHRRRHGQPLDTRTKGMHTHTHTHTRTHTHTHTHPPTHPPTPHTHLHTGTHTDTYSRFRVRTDAANVVGPIDDRRPHNHILEAVPRDVCVYAGE
jgi:hypothetical protein